MVAQSLRQRDPGQLHVDVFDVSECKTMEEFQRYVPDVGAVLQTPVVGLWQDGKLTTTATGKEARDLVARTCGFDDATDVVGWLSSQWSSFKHPPAN
jgi:hypothetical protein